MAPRATQRLHTFHIPVMGTGFTIDTPLRVARYGISSVISLVDDVLIEQMRKVHCDEAREPYDEIPADGDDARARRITAYLDLMDRLVRRQLEAVRTSPFSAGSEITRYFEMLPDTAAKRAYHEMLATGDPVDKSRRQDELRGLVTAGSIDVNIMTKLDRDHYCNGTRLAPEFSDAMAALRGYANSSLASSIVFSAGMNQRLYAYASEFGDFMPDESGVIKKKIILKVSDWRSAVIQGKFLARRGLWVSEFRIESGLNCGGHAFATRGLLMGPILEEFRQKKPELRDTLHAVFVKACAAAGHPVVDAPLEMRVTAQGGIGTAAEHKLLLQYYQADGTGWATPFLLVPEAVNVDDPHIEKLIAAEDDDVYLSDSSPLGVPFWNLRDSASEEARRRRITEGKPGSPCPKGFLAADTEFTDRPICSASRAYQKRKLEQLSTSALPMLRGEAAGEGVVAKACICHDLAGGVTRKWGIDADATPAVCCGPNIANFSKVATLQEMVGHIYGRLSLLTNPDRPHMFIREVALYVEHLRKELEKYSLELSNCAPHYFHEFKENLLSGIDYYRQRAEQFIDQKRTQFLDDLRHLGETVERIMATYAPTPAVEVAT